MTTRTTLDKCAPPRELLEAIRAVAAGERVLPAIPLNIKSRPPRGLEQRDRAIFALRLGGGDHYRQRRLRELRNAPR